MVLIYKKIVKVSLLSLLLLSSCNIETLQGNIVDDEIKSSREITGKYILKGKAELNFDNPFNTKTVADIAIRATISLIYPGDYHNIDLREATMATGLSDSNGLFIINPGFTPDINQVMILEASKRSKGVGYSSLSLRTHVRWNGNKWESITGDNIIINKKTTAIALISSLESGVLNSEQTMNRISYSGTTSTISYTQTFTEIIYKRYYGNIITALLNSIDPVRFYANDGSFISAQDRAKLSSVKSNMHTLQTVIETYAVDWGGVYPGSMEELEQEAKGKNYWKSAKNPFNPSIDAPVFINDSDYNIAKNTLIYKGKNIDDTIFFRGAVTFEPVVTDVYGNITKYFIYSINEVGDYLQDKNANFYLTNQ